MRKRRVKARTPKPKKRREAPAPPARPSKSYQELLQSAITLIARGKSTEALKTVRRASALKPKDPKAHIIAGRILYVSRDRAGAKASFLKSAKLLKRGDRHSAYVHERLGRLYYLEGNTKKAKKHYRKVIRSARRLKVKNRILGNAYAGLGLCQHRDRRESLALMNLRKAASLGTTREYQAEIDRLLGQ